MLPLGACSWWTAMEQYSVGRAGERAKEKPRHRSGAPTSVLRRPRRSGRLRIVVNLAGGCAQHDTTWEFPVADPLASATEREVQELARPFWSRARSKTSQIDPRLSL